MFPLTVFENFLGASWIFPRLWKTANARLDEMEAKIDALERELAEHLRNMSTEGNA